MNKLAISFYFIAYIGQMAVNSSALEGAILGSAVGVASCCV
ncbi:hypothetical protein [Myroides sp. N17-2]|nr:hypothetical protein [Myroides sp. N17-2]